MNPNRVGLLAAAAGCALALLLAGGVAHAQDVTGRVVGRVLDKDTGGPLAGVTVIVQGPQGEDGAVTDAQGDYAFTSLPAGKYTIRFFLANTAVQAEQPDVAVLAAKTVRVNARIAGAVQTQQAETYVIKGKPPSVDVGSARVGATFDEEFTRNSPVGRTFGEIIEKAPVAFVDPTGNVSIAGSTGLENTYTVNGLNVTGMEMGNLDSGASTLGGGTNLPLEFLSQIDVSSGGYTAEFGGGMGGVISTVLKSGSNDTRGSAFTYLSHDVMTGTYKIPPAPLGGVLRSKREPSFDLNIGGEVGGAIIKNQLYYWVGFAPRVANSTMVRLLYPRNVDGSEPTELTAARRNIEETHRTFSYAATLDWVATADHHTTLALWGTPSINKQMRSFLNQETISHPDWAIEQLNKINTDVNLHHISKLLDRHLVLEGNAGLHHEDFTNKSPNAALNNRNQLEYWGSNLFDLEGIEACRPQGDFQPCPVDNYHTGGFGQVKTYTGNRWLGELKASLIGDVGGRNEFKVGWRGEYSDFEQNRYYSGAPGERALVQLVPNGGNPVGAPYPYFDTQSFFTLPQGENPSDFGGPTKPYTDFLHPPYYRDNLKARVKSTSHAFFVQDAYSPAVLPNLTVNLGVRFELQKMTDYHANAFLDTVNTSPRLSFTFDPFNDGRSKISASYGSYFETIPMNLAARYFGGEGLVIRNAAPLMTCPGATSDPYQWTGAGEWRGCGIPGPGQPDNTGAFTNPFNNGSTYPVQSHLKGQYHNEVVATLEREVVEDLTVRLDYQHRWLGNIIEDGTGDPTGSFAFVLANPGHVPEEALKDARNDVTKLMGMDQSDAAIASQTAAAQQKLANLEVLAKAPKPQRTYDALTVTVNKRFSQAWRARASYTYSRLVGNYQGLYQVEGDYFAPNGSNAYDTPDLYANQYGRLPNDHPHQGRLDGSYTLPVGTGSLTFGLGFAARSGMPRNYVSSWYFNQPQNMLLPRGSAGRTPPISQFDLRLAYLLPLSKIMKFEFFADIFNLFNQQAALLTDDLYTSDLAPAIVNGSVSDLKFAKNFLGAPVSKNPNFGQPIKYQAPISGRLGLRLSF